MNLDNLRRAITQRPRREDSRNRTAAVLIPILVDDDGTASIILTRRADTLSTHRGEVAFPGGGVEPEDADLVATALREAQEEVNIHPNGVDVLGMLDDMPTITNRMMVTPVVGVLSEPPQLVADPIEVARIFTIPINALINPEGWVIKHHEHSGRDWPVYYFDWDGETLWGLSAYITLQLLSLLPTGGPFELPPPYDRRLG